jgi:hypothetical protein
MNDIEAESRAENRPTPAQKFDRNEIYENLT